MPMSNLNDIFFTPAANQELTYDQVLEDVQRYFAENHASTIAEAGEGNAERATSLLKELMEHYIVKRKYALDGLSTKELCSKLYEDMAGYDDADLHYDHLSGGALYRGYEFARGILWLIGIRHGISGRFHTCSSYGRQIHREVSVCTQAIFHSGRHTILFHLD